ncbi:XapX domain-containing protein [Burkholderia sp. OK233]|nr:XapX domain-containing protein [Burkholderia sp. OK233]
MWLPAFQMGMNNMKAYLISLVAGVVVGLIYSVMQVKSPAPPTVALVGLLGMLAGEHVIPFVRTWLAVGIH